MQSFLFIIAIFFLQRACTINASIKIYNPGFINSVSKKIRVAIKEYRLADDTIRSEFVFGDRIRKKSSTQCCGVDIFEDNTKLEAWVCRYSNGSINVFSFNKKP